jgi:hypothetical protein
MKKFISPVDRITEQLDLSEKIRRLGMTVPLEFKDLSDQSMKYHIFANCYVFSSQRLHEFVNEIVKFSYEETFNLLKRKMNYEDND